MTDQMQHYTNQMMMNGTMPNYNGMMQSPQMQQPGMMPNQMSGMPAQNQMSGMPAPNQMSGMPVPNQMSGIPSAPMPMVNVMRTQATNGNFSTQEAANLMSNMASAIEAQSEKIGTGQYQIINMDESESKLLSETIDQEEMDKMRSDFDILEGMNLVDDDALLDDLHINSTLSAEKVFMYSYLTRKYLDRYDELVQIYPSLKLYINFCLAHLIYSDEQKFKKQCTQLGANDDFKLPQFGADINTAFLSVTRKRTRNIDVSSTKNIDDEKKSKLDDTKNSKPIHPFLKTPYYMQFQTIFHLGRCLKYVIPADFAVTVATATYGGLNNLEKEKKKSVYNGLKINLKLPVVGILSVRINNNFSFMQLKLMDNLGSMITKMTGLTCYSDSFAFGNKQGIKCMDIVLNRTQDLIKDETTPQSTAHMVTLVNNFAVFARKSGSFVSKAYSEAITLLDKSHFDVEPDMAKKFLTAIEQHQMRREEELNDYETQLAKYINEIDEISKEN